MRLFPAAAVVAASALNLLIAACAADDDDDTTDAYQSRTIELQDIFVPDRLVEVPVLPAGTVVVEDIYVHNAGDQLLTVYDVLLDSQSDPNWSLDESTVPESIEAHGFAVLKVRYIASQALDTFASLTIFSDDPDEAQKTVAFVGRQATSGPHVTVSASLLDWGFQFRGIERRKLLTINNIGDEPLHITGVEIIQNAAYPQFALACPGQALADCDWAERDLPRLLADAVQPGSGALLEVVFAPDNLQSASAQLKIQTDDPLRPEFTVFLLGNGGSSLNCTPPTIEVTSPLEATVFRSYEEMTITLRVQDDEQPADTLYVEMFIGDLLIEDEFPDENGRVAFHIDLAEHEPTLPPGLVPLTFRATDGCPTFGYDALVVAIDFPLAADDVDGDGFNVSQGDCDDNDSDSFPQSIERFDGSDNDCDGVIDEGTVVWDNDCDGFCAHPTVCLGQTVVEGASCAPLGPAGQNGGDCNDSVLDLDQDGQPDGRAIQPGATELLNFVDDDCDGVVDEATPFFDDDGDGQTEAIGDCDDADPDTFLGAVEYCDGKDNDCNGPIDDLCLVRDPEPRIVGQIVTDRFQVQLGGRVRAEILVVSPDPDLTYAWESDRDGTFDDPTAGPVALWNAPEDTSENRSAHLGEFVNLVVVVTDSLGQSARGFGNLLINQNVQISYTPVSGNPNGTGCSLSGSGGLGVLLLLLRRRR